MREIMCSVWALLQNCDLLVIASIVSRDQEMSWRCYEMPSERTIIVFFFLFFG